MMAMKDNMAAALSWVVLNSLGSELLKCDAPVPAVTHQTISGGIQMKVSILWIQLIPRTQSIQTTVQIMITPAQVGHRPSLRAFSTAAPEIELIAFQPVVATMEKMTTRILPQ